MPRIQATLPTLGSVPVYFHKESAELYEFMGRREFSRLRSVPHLGVAASVFTGISHSRLEYMLLQCAVIGLVAKLHKQDEQYALSNEVVLNGMSRTVSSGEELLKTWAMLSNFGHTQYTYGVERGLLQFAVDNVEFREWLIRCTRFRDLQVWRQDVIDGYIDDHFHYLFAMARIGQLPPMDRRKSRFLHYLRNFLLPPDQLFPTDPAARFKITRLRLLFSRIRLLSMVALDSHYSHHPITLNLNSAVISLIHLVPTSGRDGGFDQLLNSLAGWLADELYLHPFSVAAQRDYELKTVRLLRRRFERATTPDKRNRLVDNIAHNGFGKPSTRRVKHLLRLTFPRMRGRLLGQKTLYEIQKQLELELASPPRSYVSVDRNPFTRSTHVDLLVCPHELTTSDVALFFRKTQNWLVRVIETETLSVIKRLYPPTFRKDRPRFQTIRRRQFERRLESFGDVIHTLFMGVIEYILPADRKASVSGFMPASGRSLPILYRVRDSEGGEFGNISSGLKNHINKNPLGLSPDRIHELRCLQKAARNFRSDFVIVCPEKFVVYDEFGRGVDEWDGTAVEISDEKVLLWIVEAKSGGGAKRRENDAFAQLKETRDLIRDKNRIPYRRIRIPRFGAAICFTLSTQSQEKAIPDTEKASANLMDEVTLEPAQQIAGNRQS